MGIDLARLDAALSIAGRLARSDAGRFKESDHPRGQPENAGQFGPGGGRAKSKEQPKGKEASKAAAGVPAKAAKAARGTASSGMMETKVVKGQRVLASGKPLPKHLASLRIPPAWTDVKVATNADAGLLATGNDAKGRVQSIYSAGHHAKAGALKFARTDALIKAYPALHKQNDKARSSKDQTTKDAADCALVVMVMGLRPGTSKDTGGEVQAAGATQLEARNVRVSSTGNVSLNFVGKKGVRINLSVDDPDIAKMLASRKKGKDGNEPIFSINEKKLLEHMHSLGDGSFTPKDFRTRIGTTSAMAEVSKLKKEPKNAAEYKKMVKAVATKVAERLGNTPTIALQSYVNPSVFARWRMAAGV